MQQVAFLLQEHIWSYWRAVEMEISWTLPWRESHSTSIIQLLTPANLPATLPESFVTHIASKKSLLKLEPVPYIH